MHILIQYVNQVIGCQMQTGSLKVGWEFKYIHIFMEKTVFND